MTQQDIKRLQKISGYPCVSIFIPTHRTMPDRLQDFVRVKDLIGQAIELLLKEFPRGEVEPFMATLGALAGKIDYTKTLDGIVIFANKDMAEMYIVPFKIPEKVIIDDNFYTHHFTRALNRDFQYWALMLNSNSARLFTGSGSTLSEVRDSAELCAKQKGFPFEWQWEVTSDKIVQASHEGCKNGSYRTAKEDQFLHEVDRALDAHLSVNESPLVIVGAGEHCGEFKKVTKHAARIIGYKENDLAHASFDVLAKAIEPVIRAYQAQEKKAALDLFFECVGTGKSAAGMLEVWQRAYEGRARILLIEEGFAASGFKNAEKPEEIILHQDKKAAGISEDLVDDLVELVLSKGGKIVFVPKDALKDQGHVGAILRY